MKIPDVFSLGKWGRKLFFGIIMFPLAFSAQETLPYYQQYLLGGEFHYNPALYGSTDDMVLNLTHQKQYSSYDEGPTVQTIGLHTNVVDRLGAGLGFFRDSNGPISANGITAGASYTIPFGQVNERTDHLSFGTSVSAYNMSFDTSKITADPNDPLLTGNANDLFLFYANIGVHAGFKRAFAGVSVNDIPLSNDRPIVNGIEPSPIKIFIHGGYAWEVNDNIEVTPSVMVNLNTNSSRIIDLNLLGSYGYDRTVFSLGASFRMANNQFGNQTLSISPLLKADINRLSFGAAYSIGLSDIHREAGNGFMLSFSYSFENIINSRGFRY